jgi:hypothetical protein
MTPVFAPAFADVEPVVVQSPEEGIGAPMRDGEGRKIWVVVTKTALAALDPAEPFDVFGGVKTFLDFRDAIESAAAKKFLANGVDPAEGLHEDGSPILIVRAEDLSTSGA